MKALLFINGEPPKELPSLSDYNIIGCTDGAFIYLQKMDFPFHYLDFISGDFDSFSPNELQGVEIIHTPDQNETDFHKALRVLEQKGVEKVDVFGGSGGEMDHFLGNLSVASRFIDKMEITFHDQFSSYYFIPQSFSTKIKSGKMVSLYPFPFADGIVTNGLNWNLNNEFLDITERIGTRNFAIEDEISISYKSGKLLVFIEK